MSTQLDDLRAIRQLAADWRAGWLQGDPDLLLSLWDENAVLMPQDSPPIKGKDAIRPLYQAILKDYSITSESTLMEVEASGNWGYFWSTYDLTATPKAGGSPIHSKGKSVFIVKRDSQGAWKITRLIDNSDGAPARDNNAH